MDLQDAIVELGGDFLCVGVLGQSERTLQTSEEPFKAMELSFLLLSFRFALAGY